MSEPMWPSKLLREPTSEDMQDHIHPISGKKCFGRLLEEGDRIDKRYLHANDNGNWEQPDFFEWGRSYNKEKHGLVVRPLLPLDLN